MKTFNMRSTPTNQPAPIASPTAAPKGRRGFLRTTAALASGFAGASFLPGLAQAAPVFADNDINVLGPREGYSPHIGTLVSMMNWMRPAVLRATKGMTTEQLDFLLDDKANTIGALMYHLAATDAFYYEHTFKGKEWGKFDPDVMKKFGTAMELGPTARASIKGNNLDFYLSLLEETRERTLAAFRKRDDAWLLAVDPKWYWGPTNNYCKWFHVCEHESHHTGQISLIAGRLPGRKVAE